MENAESDLDRLEQLATLYALRDRYGLSLASAVLRPTTESERHRLEHGHYLRLGCCRKAAQAA